MNSRGAMFAQAARGPVLLILVGVLFALQQAGILDIWRSWPLLIIAVGVMKLIERVLAGPAPAAPWVGNAPGAGRPPYGAGYPAAGQPRPGPQPPPGGGTYR